MRRQLGIRMVVFLAAAISIATGLGLVAFTVHRVAAHQLAVYSYQRDVALARKMAITLQVEYSRGGWPALSARSRQFARFWQMPIEVRSSRAPQKTLSFTPGFTTASSPERSVGVNMPLSRQHRTIPARLILPAPPSFTPRLSPVVKAIESALKSATIIGFLASLLLSVLIGERMLVPLRRIAQGAHQLAEGKLHHRIRTSGPKELTALADDFNRMAAALERSEGQRRQLVADFAHELRTPLSVLLGYLEALRDGVSVREADPLSVAVRQTRHVANLVEDLQELALADAKVLPMKLTALRPLPLVREVVDEFRWRAEQKSVALVTEFPRHAPPVRADGGRLGQAVRNLLNNAVTYSPVGGTVTVRLIPSEAAVRIEVADNGPGIAADQLPQIFDRFYRVDPARSKDTGGVGLGLAIAKHLVELQGGSIGVASEVGRGSRFWIDLPAIG